MLLRAVLLVALLFVSTACEGPAGPTGPQGPPGPAGSLNRYVVTVTVNSAGVAAVNLPAAAGANPASPPGLDCYLSTGVSLGAWLNVTDGDGSTTAFCGLVLNSAGWRATMNDAPPGWVALFIATW